MTDDGHKSARGTRTSAVRRTPTSKQARRHHVTIMFCDVSGSTRIAASLEPEAYASLLETMRERAEDIIGRHGGTIVRIDGDGIASIFGYPDAFEDAARRATEAALELRDSAKAIGQSVSGLKQSLSFHTGIHAGVVLIKPGDVVRGRFEMLGDPTNVAARIADAAAPNEILVSDAALGADAAFFSAKMRSIGIAGRNHPLRVNAISGRAAVQTRFDARAYRGETLLVGRQAELAAIEMLFAQPTEKSVSIAALVGPAGIGKTRLANVFAARARALGAITVYGSCEAYLAAPPLQPFRQIADALKTSGLAGTDGLAKALQGATADPAERRPLIMVIDDWQWADDASRILLDSLLATPTGGHVFVLLSTRTKESVPDLPDGSIITLPPLNPEASLQAIGSLLPASTPFLHEHLAMAAGGNPLFLEELCHAQARGRQSDRQTNPNVWMDLLIEARVAALDDDHARLVRIAAVIGNIVPIWLFKTLTGLDEQSSELAYLSDADFLYATDTPGIWRFKHGITRDAIYRTVCLDDRRAWHAAIVEALNSDPVTHIDALAYHSEQAGNRNQSIEFALSAGDRAMAVHALDRAQSHYRNALLQLDDGAIDDPRLLTRLIHKYGHACVVDPSHEQLPIVESGAALAARQNNDEAHALALYWSGALRYGLGASRSSIASLSQALTIAEKLGHRKLAIQIIANLGQSHLVSCDYIKASPLIEQAIDTMRGWDTARTPTGLVYTLGCKAFMLADMGDFAEADAIAVEAESLIGSVAPAMLGSHLTKRSATALWRADFQKALELASRALDHDARTHSRFNTMMARSLRAYALWCLEGDKQQIEALNQFVTWFQNSDNRHRVSLCHGWLAGAYAKIGRDKEVRKYAAAAFIQARHGDALGFGDAARAMATLSARNNRQDLVERYLKMARSAAKARGSRREEAATDRCEAQLAFDANDIQRSKALFSRAANAYDAMGLHQLAEDARANR